MTNRLRRFLQFDPWSLVALFLASASLDGFSQVITGFNPRFGQPGTQVVIEGPNFDGFIEVRFNGTLAGATPTASTQIIATVPNGATTGPISVKTSQGTILSPFNFTVIGDEPFILDFEPNVAPPGTTVTITGANFTEATAVLFNGASAQFFPTADTQILAAVPTAATTGPISVVNRFGTNNSPFNFFVPPVITAFAPTNGAPGDLINLYGLNFIGALDVRFGDLSALFTVKSNTNITAILPVGALSGPVLVFTPAGFVISDTNFLVAPRITSFSPAVGGPLTSVDIQGANLTNATSVSFNGATAGFTVKSSTLITATAPNGVSSGPISVTTPGGTVTSTTNFFAPPRISGFTPSGGPTGALVTITGFNFLGTTNVKFGGTNAVITSVSTNQIVTSVPARAPTGPISVSAPAGSFSTTSNFVVFTTIDLAVGQTDTPDPVQAADLLTYNISVTNRGPKDASAVALTNLLGSGVVFISATLSQGISILRENAVICLLGAMPNGAVATITIQGIPTVVGTVTNTISVGANEPDSGLANNLSSIKTTVVAPPKPSLSIQQNPTTPGVLDVSWPKSFSNFVLQSTGTLSSPTWTPILNQISDVGDRYTYSFLPIGSRLFFRLKR